MISLFLDSATAQRSVVLLDDNKVLASRMQLSEKDHSKEMLPEISQVLKEANLNPTDIDTIFVVVGPGSFTGIRIGVTIAKTYAWTLKKRIVPLSSLEVMAYTNATTDLVVPFIDARRGNVYAGIYDKTGHVIIKDCHCSFEDLKNRIPLDKTVTWVSLDQKEGMDIHLPNPDWIRLIAIHQTDLSLNPHLVNPNYLKETEAEENRHKENHD